MTLKNIFNVVFNCTINHPILILSVQCFTRVYRLASASVVLCYENKHSIIPKKKTMAYSWPNQHTDLGK